jgi:hypothetical protein
MSCYLGLVTSWSSTITTVRSRAGVETIGEGGMLLIIHLI